MTMPAKILIVFVLLLIIASLVTALVYLLKDRDRSPRTVKALTVRIVMSIGLFLFLLFGYRVGLLQPHGLQGGMIHSRGAGAGLGSAAHNDNLAP
jgi:uncharacterized protein with PQ loop repeat